MSQSDDPVEPNIGHDRSHYFPDLNDAHKPSGNSEHYSRIPRHICLL